MAKIISAYVMKLENSLAILIHALRRIRLMLNFNLQRKPFMKYQQPLINEIIKGANNTMMIPEIIMDRLAITPSNS